MSSAKLDFEMTPELEVILQRELREPGTWLHPSMKSDTQMDGFKVVYNAEMTLPEPDDKNGLLAWLGVNEGASEKVLKYYERLVAKNPDGRLYQYKSDTPESILVNHLCAIFLLGRGQEWDFDEAEDFGIQYFLFYYI
ncbi:uncharacterized protein BP5553_08583 [Venustampulla echinocandica]|uniref:Uncharacterized protein n=1 Tax=Venustampulla echinocandica TaxID=2656787 RepID=A0A370TEM1_9HELO|nr:uncharacterized protein BP5553_08583 [Venustampulla echinocandica]RDL33144.1 hypothetical protein BP5553_08583 [Venustampulla echinocandica]